MFILHERKGNIGQTKCFTASKYIVYALTMIQEICQAVNNATDGTLINLKGMLK